MNCVLEGKIQEYKRSYERKLAQKNYIEDTIQKLSNEITNKKELDIELNKINILLNETSNISRELAKEKLQTLVTNALQFTLEKDIKFVIDLSIKRDTPSVEFKLETTVNNKKCILDPINSNGGGVIDIISTALRYAYLMAIDEGLAKILILDEPGKMISKGVSEKYAEFINDLSESFDIQTIFITHNTDLEDISPNIIKITNTNGVSKIS